MSAPPIPKSRMAFTDDNRLKGFAPVGIEAILQASKLNNSALWCVSQTLSRGGVLVPRSKLSMAAIEQRIAAIASHYPINDGNHAMGVAVHETFTMRGFHMIGDDVDIATLWANLYLYEVNIKGWDVGANAVCWTASSPNAVYVPYIDIDERDLEGNFHRVWTSRIAPTIKIIHDALSSRVPNLKSVIFFNNRPDGDLWKYSFHVHWPQVGVSNVLKWKSFLLSLTDLPRKLKWEKKPLVGWVVTHDDKTPIFDPAVYGGTRQLFRGPFCGKNGAANSVMLPCVLRKTDDVFGFHRKQYTLDECVAHILDARISRSPNGLIMLEFGGVERSISTPTPLVDVTEASDVPVSSPDQDKNCPILDFVMPFFRVSVLPKWQKMRHEMLMTLRSQGGTVPLTNLRLKKNVSGRRPGQRFMSVEGDTFCEIDDSHAHNKSRDVIGITVDFFKGTIQQSCFACQKRGAIYQFLHADNRIEISTESDCRFTATSFWGPSDTPYQLILDYYMEMFVQQRLTRTLWVYDQESCIWRTDLAGNMVTGKLADDLNQKHRRYLKEYKLTVVAKQIANLARTFPDDDEEERKVRVKKVEESARVFMKKNTPLLHFSATSRGKIIDELKSYTIHREVADMNRFSEFIPMKNKKFVNVFTGEVSDMEAQHFFTSCVNAEFSTDTEDLQEIEQLFKELSTGDIKKCAYIKMISGYCFTFLVHDRKFYVLLGSGSNGKGLLKQFIMDISKGPEGFDSRAKNLLQSYWAFGGNQNTSPENATPESYELQNKTFLYTDDISPVPLDTNKLKRVVAAEDQSGRGLYGKPVDIKVRGKVMWTTNYPPAGPGEDIAYWERASYIPMGAKYVEKGPDPLNFRFLKNYARYQSLLEKKDAFFTIVVRELIAYYKLLPWDNVRKQPAELGPFPMPPSVLKRIFDARAQRFPLAAFVKEYTTKTRETREYAKVNELFTDYITYLDNINELKIKRETTLSTFEQLIATSLDMIVMDGFVEGIKIVKHVIASKRSYLDENVHDMGPPVGYAQNHPDGFFLDRGSGPTIPQ